MKGGSLLEEFSDACKKKYLLDSVEQRHLVWLGDCNPRVGDLRRYFMPCFKPTLTPLPYSVSTVLRTEISQRNIAQKQEQIP